MIRHVSYVFYRTHSPVRNRADVEFHRYVPFAGGTHPCRFVSPWARSIITSYTVKRFHQLILRHEKMDGSDSLGVALTSPQRTVYDLMFRRGNVIITLIGLGSSTCTLKSCEFSSTGSAGTLYCCGVIGPRRLHVSTALLSCVAPLVLLCYPLATLLIESHPSTCHDGIA